MEVKINGAIKSFANINEISLSELLEINNVENPEMVSVQLNGAFIRKEEFEKTTIKNDDELDFLYFMGGGSAFYQSVLS